MIAHTLKIDPIFFPSSIDAPTSVTVSSAMPQTPIALATLGPSARRLAKEKMANFMQLHYQMALFTVYRQQPHQLHLQQKPFLQTSPIRQI